MGLDNRDDQGRLFQPYQPDELQLLFERWGFQQIGRWDTDDVLQRAGTRWVTMLLELRSGPVRAVDQIEGILNRDRKVATYKFALFRALAEIATQEPRAARWLPDERVAVPMERTTPAVTNTTAQGCITTVQGTADTSRRRHGRQF